MYHYFLVIFEFPLKLKYAKTHKENMLNTKFLSKKKRKVYPLHKRCLFSLFSIYEKNFSALSAVFFAPFKFLNYILKLFYDCFQRLVVV